ncbi:DNA polymerase III subunit beta [bacterium]|nr:DNA polymerase III subunit beta [bacterium]NDC94341.1 DNA polymerase III subunit beta [bacterium]NDD84444.1 DNA polymerase III subunit beta [bacterium]NDG30318.1 DNA polymerase III subunit beta [bacterium]
MKLQVTQENLSRALSAVGRIASGRNTLPILSNVLLSTIDNRLKIAATNLEVALTETIGAKVSAEGSVTVPARLLQELISAIPDGVITLELAESRLLVTSDGYESVINGTPADDFPVMPTIKEGVSITIEATTFKKGLQQVVGSASSDDARPVLTAVYLHTYNGSLYAVATDSYRLAEKALVACKDEVSLLIPASSLQDVLRIMQDDAKDITITYDELQARFAVGDVELITRLIDGAYPDYRKLIPEAFKTTAVIQKTDLTTITKVSSLFAREVAGSVTIKIDADSGDVSIRSVASQLGENTARAKAQITGSGDVTLNSRYLLDALSVISGGSVSVNINGKLDPVIIKDPAQADYVNVIMPVKS